MDCWSLYAAEYTLCYKKRDPEGWKTPLQPQALISQPVAEFVHLAEPQYLCSPFSVHAWEPNGFVFECLTLLIRRVVVLYGTHTVSYLN